MEATRLDINRLMEQRASIEAEIEERTLRLNAPGQPGMQGSLLDKEGFPRSDIDVHAVRTDRNAVIRLTNDHKAISQDLEQLLHKLHALARESGVTVAYPQQQAAAMNQSAVDTNGTVPAATVSGAAGSATTLAAFTSNGTSEQHEDKKPRLDAAAQPQSATGVQSAAAAAAQPGSLRPFAVVDEVADNSPAAAAGIQLGDQLCRFGAAVAGSGTELQDVARELQQHENQPVEVVFLRHGQPVQMQLVPRHWEGRGLLGCHLRPL